MQEKVITIYDIERFEIKGLVICVEKDIGFIKDRIVLFGEHSILDTLSAHIERFEKTHIMTVELQEIVVDMAKNCSDYDYLMCLDPFTLKSDNKNRSSRFKRMLDKMNLSHFERRDILK